MRRSKDRKLPRGRYVCPKCGRGITMLRPFWSLTCSNHREAVALIRDRENEAAALAWDDLIVPADELEGATVETSELLDADPLPLYDQDDETGYDDSLVGTVVRIDRDVLAELREDGQL